MLLNQQGRIRTGKRIILLVKHITNRFRMRSRLNRRRMRMVLRNGKTRFPTLNRKRKPLMRKSAHASQTGRKRRSGCMKTVPQLPSRKQTNGKPKKNIGQLKQKKVETSMALIRQVPRTLEVKPLKLNLIE